jgi:LCP family protein required for cell wall assembly
MKHKLLVGILTLVGMYILSSCQQPQFTPIPTIVETSPAPTPTAWVSYKQVRLPLIKNGSEYTPTPFLPHESTPIALPTPAPQAYPDLGARAYQPDTPLVTPIPRQMPLLGDQAQAGNDLINILLIGSDQRTQGPYFRTDTLIIASIRPRDQVVSMISIPRDLFVYIPGWTMQRINTAYLHGEMSKYPGGGAALLKDTILYNLGIRIDNLAVVDFNGFIKIVNVLDGVDVPLACPYTDWRAINPKGNLENPNNWRLYTVGPGVVHMDGEFALWYARSRLRSNDFDRGRRQQEVLRSIYTKALQLGILPRIPELYQQVSKIVKTDIGLNDVLALAPMALKLDAPRIRSYYISSKYVKGWWTPQGASVLLPKREKLEPMLQEAMSPPDNEEDERLNIPVEVRNGTKNDDLLTLAAERLHYGGFETFFSDQNADEISKTWLYDLTDGKNPAVGEYILKILGLPDDRLQPGDTAGSKAAYVLVIGADYNPCFNPSKINR